MMIKTTVLGLLTMVLLLFVATACSPSGDTDEPPVDIEGPAVVFFFTDN